MVDGILFVVHCLAQLRNWSGPTHGIILLYSDHNEMELWMIFIPFFWMAVMAGEDDGFSDGRRSLASFSPIVDLGNSSVLGDRSTFAALIRTFGGDFDSSKEKLSEGDLERARHSLQASLPIPLVQWNTLTSRPCPQYTSTASHRVERGHGMSHLQVWLEFIFFDNDVDEARFRPKPEYLLSNWYSSVSGAFQAYENGTRTKNGLLYLEDDIMLIFEDGVVPTANFSMAALAHDVQNVFLQRSHNNSAIDFVSLMHCDNEKSLHQHHSHNHNALHSATGSASARGTRSLRNNNPNNNHEKDSIGSNSAICLGAYAITRRAARILAKILDVCGKRVASQLQAFASEGLLSARATAHAHFQLFAEPFPSTSSPLKQITGS